MADVARLRGLPMTVPVPFTALDDDAFQRAARGVVGPVTQGEKQNRRFDQFNQAFTIGSADSATRGARAIYDAELGGFYDPSTQQLYLRGKEATTTPLGRAILEHETEHALQDRMFGFPDFKTLSFDSLLAVRALYEGDATMTAAVVEAGRSGVSPATAVANLVRSPLKASIDKLTEAARQAPPMVREQILWPYFGGTTFVAQLASVGGWSLVNAAFEHPPTTTEQVLHVEKYLAGEQPVRVSPPPPPDGYAAEVRGTMGELATRLFLEQCSSDADARLAATGWGGDAFTVVSARANASEAQSLLWSTTWDDALSAARFARALEDRRICLRTGAKPDLSVVREGNRVAFVQGLASPEERRREAELLFPLAGEPAPLRPPVEGLAPPALPMRPAVPRDFTARGRVEGRTFVDDAIGVRAPLFGLTTKYDPSLDLLAFGGPLRVAIMSLWSAPSAALSDAVVAEVVEGIRKNKPADVGELLERDAAPVKLSWTTAMGRTLRIGDREEERIVLAPTCGGKITLVLFTRSAPGAYGESIARAWLDSVQATDSSPACEALKSLRDPERK
jgi:hypothetical protein